MRGARYAHTQIEVQEWMTKNGIPIAVIQETKKTGIHKIERKHYTWFFSGGGYTYATRSSNSSSK